MLDPGEIARRARTPPPYRAAARRAHPIQAAARARRGDKQFRRAGIERRAVGVARPWAVRLPLRHQPCDLGAALETRIDQTLGRKLFERLAIVGEMLGLPPHRLFPGDAEPGEVLIDRGLEFRLAARRVDILDAQQEPPAGPAAPDRNSATPNKRGRDADSRSGSAQNGRQAALNSSHSSLPGIVVCPAQATPSLVHDFYDMRWMRGSSPRMTTLTS